MARVIGRWIGSVFLVPASLLPLPSCAFRADRPAESDVLGLYLGRDLPDTVPVIFAPGIVSTGSRELNAAFTPDGRELLFARRIDGALTMLRTRWTSTGWTEPEPLRLTRDDPLASAADMMVSPDGDRLYFLSYARTDLFPPGTANIWVSRRIRDHWADAEVMPRPVNSDANDLYPMLVADGSMYFASDREGGLGGYDIYRAQYRDGAFSEVVNLGGPINSAAHDGDPYVAPDERYMIFPSQREGGFGGFDLYISFRRSDGTWEEPVNMGARFNSEVIDYAPMVSPDGRFFFYSQGDDVLWVDARILDRFHSGPPN